METSQICNLSTLDNNSNLNTTYQSKSNAQMVSRSIFIPSFLYSGTPSNRNSSKLHSNFFSTINLLTTPKRGQEHTQATLKIQTITCNSSTIKPGNSIRKNFSNVARQNGIWHVYTVTVMTQNVVTVQKTYSTSSFIQLHLS